MNTDDILQKSHLKSGLTSFEAEELLLQFGYNRLPEERPPSDFFLLLSQLKSPLIYVLVLASFVTVLLGDIPDALIILLAVGVNTVLGFYQERKASRALLSLKKILTPRATVVRDGKMAAVDTALLVPGDIVVLNHGDKIPTDGVLLEEASFSVNEAILTGESFPVHKTLDQSLFMGTLVSSGRGKMMVVKTGKETEMGKIAEELRATPNELTPLQKRLSRLASQLAFIVFLMSVFIFSIGILGGREILEMFTMAVAIAVSAIPEGLVVSLTAILAIGMQRILKRKAIVRKLVAAETLGSVTVIATDKTGTLTEGNLKVVKTEFPDAAKAFSVMILANNFSDPLEVAMWEWATKEIKDKNSAFKGFIGEFHPEKMVEENKRVWEVPFDPEKKFMAVGFEDGAVCVSGAPEIVLKKSQFPNPNDQKKWEEKIEQWGREGLRMVGLAYKVQSAKFKVQSQKEEINDLEWVGVVGFEDPIRKGVKEALALCRRAGIRTCVVTGDYRGTAEAVLRKVDLEVPNGEGYIMEGYELERLETEELAKRIANILLFTRVTPSQKLKIVEALKARGEVVALVGDGVNDAPALRKADIGIVVGEATETAKETADIVLLDSNFATIVAAIEEGRGIFSNLRKIILYLLSDSFAEMITIIGAVILGIPLPLTAAQIIWVNLIDDGFPSLALTVDPKDKELMHRRPISSRASLLDFEILSLIFVISLITGLFTLGLFYWVYTTTSDIVSARTMAFVFLGISTLFYVFSCRNLHKPIWHDHVLSNRWLLKAVAAGLFLQLVALYIPFFQQFFGTRPLSFSEWGLVLSGVLLVIFLIEGVKFFLRKK